MDSGSNQKEQQQNTTYVKETTSPTSDGNAKEEQIKSTTKKLSITENLQRILQNGLHIKKRHVQEFQNVKFEKSVRISSDDKKLDSKNYSSKVFESREEYTSYLDKFDIDEEQTSDPVKSQPNLSPNQFKEFTENSSPGIDSDTKMEMIQNSQPQLRTTKSQDSTGMQKSHKKKRRKKRQKKKQHVQSAGKETNEKESV